MIASGDLTENELFDILDEEGFSFDDMEKIFSEVRAPKEQEADIAQESIEMPEPQGLFEKMGMGMVRGEQSELEPFQQSETVQRGVGAAGLDFASLASLIMGSPDYESMGAPTEMEDLTSQIQQGASQELAGRLGATAEELVEPAGLSGEFVRRATRAAPAAMGGAVPFAAMETGELGGLAARETAKEMGLDEDTQDKLDLLFQLGVPLGTELIRLGASSVKSLLGKTPKSAILAGDLGPLEKEVAAKTQRVAQESMVAPKSKSVLRGEVETLGQESASEFRSKLKSVPPTEELVSESFEDIVSKKKSAKGLDNIIKDENIQNIGPSVDRQEDWKSIQKSARQSFNSAKNEYDELYGKARNELKGVKVDPTNAQKKLVDTIRDFKGLDTVPDEFKSMFKKSWNDLNMPGDWTDVFSKKGVKNVGVARKKIPAENLLDFNKNISDWVNYESENPNSKKMLGRVIQGSKQDLRAIGGDFLDFYNSAESSYADAAQKHSHPSVRALRGAEDPASIANRFSSGQKYENLTTAISDDPEAIRRLEAASAREIFGKKGSSAQKHFDNVRKHMSSNAVDNIESGLGASESKSAMRARGEEAFLKSISEIESGRSPSTAKKMILNGGNGRKIAISSLKDIDGGMEIFKSLNRDIIEDMLPKITTDTGAIDFNKAGKFFRDDNIKQIMTDAYGHSGAAFVDELVQNQARVVDGFDKIALRAEANKIKIPTPAERASFMDKTTKASIVLFEETFLPKAFRVPIRVAKAWK